MDAFEPVNKQAVQPPSRSPSSGAARVNMQNIQEFNQLKYRGNGRRRLLIDWTHLSFYAAFFFLAF